MRGERDVKRASDTVEGGCCPGREMAEPRKIFRIEGTAAARPGQARIAQELSAVVTAVEQATQKILAAAERIDRLTNQRAMPSGQQTADEVGKDIRALVAEIFAACNFHDIIGQRVAKVIASLSATDVTNVAPLHGPRLEGDGGHAAQSDIDLMFARPRRRTSSE